MLANYLKVGIRNILKHKAFSFINIFGLAAAMSVCMLIMLTIADQKGYDSWQTNRNRIYRVQTLGRNGSNSTIAALASATTTATATTAGVKPLIWKISNAACSISDTISVRVVSPAVISAGSNFTAGCSGNCVTLNGSDPGLSPQSGLWQLVSGPSTPTFANSNLHFN
jgi:hypothetical protein